ncbi:hypothetical protein C1889_04235 [Pseudomonas sp. FW507-12TSA]|nr:hypothetical protein C1889_04235 [Pseudomonas sp. FW507-12TSA]
MSNLGIGVWPLGDLDGCAGGERALWAPLIKKCAILAMSSPLDQLYAGKYDECCAMLRAVAHRRILVVNQTSVTTSKAAHAAIPKHSVSF